MPSQPLIDSNPIPFAFHISQLANFFAESVYRELQEREGVARSEFVVVFCLKTSGELTAQAICAVTGRPKNSVSRAVNAMLERGFIARREDPGDARRALLSLTRRGRALYDAALPMFIARENAMLAPLTKQERMSLQRILGKLVVRDDEWTAR